MKRPCPPAVMNRTLLRSAIGNRTGSQLARIGAIACIASALTMLSASACGQTHTDWQERDWERFATTPRATLLDWNTVRTQRGAGGIIGTWVRESAAVPGAGMTLKPHGPKYAFSMTLVEVSCKDTRVRKVRQHYYDKASTLVRSLAPNERFHRADAAGRSLARAVCEAME